ncbi:MAG: hypothetical protein JRI97_06100 [Deltaproteobacteria bacterium]|nr:hypothetical protein [Deltaproteobacteria bacterium]
MPTPCGPVPVVKTRMSAWDRAQAVAARVGIKRNSHKVAPGLYAMGNPSNESPVFVTANYKLSFDALRRGLSGLDAWMLVADTRGINVWCAAGKRTFSTDEVALQVVRSGLDRLVSHRRLILPQLAAPGVSGREVKKKTGFSVSWGPVRAADIKAFVDAGYKAEPYMRQVTFPLSERAVLLPVELSAIAKPLAVLILAGFVLSGIGGGLFSLSAAWHRGLSLAGGLVAAVLAGAVAMPLLLPRLPFVAFSAKGALTGAALGAAWALATAAGWLEGAALVLLTTGLSSYLAMNFTGSTPFTSGSGVEKEMRRAMPFQALAVGLALAGWIKAGFAG